MIKRIFRLNLRKIPNFFRQSLRLYTPLATIFYHCGEKTLPPQVSVIIPKKTIKLRVNRNKLKRQFYRFALPLLEENKETLRGLKIVMVPKKEIKKILSLPKNERDRVLEKDIALIFKKICQEV